MEKMMQAQNFGTKSLLQKEDEDNWDITDILN